MSIVKLNLHTSDYVEIVKLNGPLHGRRGEVIGVSRRHDVDTYIVMLDEPLLEQGFLHKAVAITESCLVRLSTWIKPA